MIIIIYEFKTIIKHRTYGKFQWEMVVVNTTNQM